MLRRWLKVLSLKLVLLLALFITSSQSRTISLHQPTTECVGNTVETITDDEEMTNTSLPESCMSLDEVLWMLESDDLVLLAPGIYTLTDFSTEVVMEISNISIIGNPTDPESVTITCAEDVGLFFFNVSDLTISGLTIERCGIRGADRIGEIVNMTREVIKFMYIPPPDFSAALFLVHCPDLELSNVIIRNNRGFGLVGINLIGTTNFYQVQVLQNYPFQCVLDLNRYSTNGGSGGGVFFVYQDYRGVWHDQFKKSSTQLYFAESNVTDNFVCRLNLFHVLHDKLPRSVSPQSLSSSLIGAGGVSLSMAQSFFQVNAYFKNCTFRNNSGTYNGAAMHVSQFELADDSHVFIEGSDFVENGWHLLRDYGDKGVGPVGALHLWYYTPNPSDHNNRRLARQLISQEPSSVVVSHSNFIRNAARSGGGICAISFGPEVGVVQDYLLLNGTVFKHNQADYGAAIYLSELSYSGFELGLMVHLHSINVSRNLKMDNSAGNTIQSESGIVELNFLNVTVTGDNYLGYNTDTALSLYSAIVTFSGNVLLEHNTGSTGGAVDMASESYLILTGSANMTFYHNRALIAGGAVHVDFDSTRFNSYDCFVFYNNPEFFCDLVDQCSSQNMSVFANFTDNDAPLGSTLYGSTFTNCPWAGGSFDEAENTTHSNYIIGRILGLEPHFTIAPSVNNTNTINTLARSIAPTEQGREYTIMPGKMLEADLGAFDQLDQPVPLTVFSQVVGEEFSGNKAAASIGATNRYLLDGQIDEFTMVPVKVYGPENSAYNLIITSNEAQVEFSLNITLTNCSLGFTYDNDTKSCECQVQNSVEQIFCENDGSVTFLRGPWIGYIDGHGFVTSECNFFDYCYQNLTQVFLDDADSQCRNNRTGILCGQCREGYSRVFGSSRCRECENYSLVLIILIALYGIFLVVVIALLNITITDGYINGIIFYCNIITLYPKSLLPPQLVDKAPSQFIINLINLQWGFEACFYNGMTDLHLAALSLLFPFYLGFILLIITVISQYCHNHHFAKLLSKVNITHVFATLLLLCYTSVIRTCIDVLSFIDIDVPGGRLRLWRIDPNQPHLSGLHIFVFIVALLLIIVLFPLPFFLISRKSLRLPYVSRLKPLVDAFIAPLGDWRQFWVGFRLLCRFFFFLLVLLEEVPRNVTICTFMILIAVLGAYTKPFKTLGRNLLDLFVMLNLTIFTFLAVVANIGPPVTSTATTFMFMLLVFFTILILGILLFYVITALPWSKKAKKKLDTYFVEHIRPHLVWFGSSDKDQETSVDTEMQSRSSSYNLADDVTHTSLVVSNLPDRSGDDDFRSARLVRYRESLFEHTTAKTLRL